MKGENKCKILRKIRQKITVENDIPLVTSKCTCKGECKGTCPTCEAELRYLENELQKAPQPGQRRSLGGNGRAVRAVLVSGILGHPR